jgi:hypothetical protein
VRRLSLIAGLSIALLALAGASGAGADRRATKGERRAVAKLVDLPPVCAKVRVSTVTPEPKWASVSWKPRPKDKCEPYARDGVGIAKRKGDRWRFVTAGSSFDCPYLYRHVPREVADDLGLDCYTP